MGPGATGGAALDLGDDIDQGRQMQLPWIWEMTSTRVGKCSCPGPGR